MKKIFYIIVIVVLLLSCTQNSLEVITASYKKEGMYGLVYVSNIGDARYTKLLFAPIDSLGDYKDTGIIVPAGKNNSFPNLFHNSANNLLIICTTDHLYFIDSETHKIKKTIPFTDENNSPHINMFYEKMFYYHNDNYCFLLYEQIIYKINIKEMTKEIAFDFRKMDTHFQERKSPNGRYLYKRTFSYSGEGNPFIFMINTYKCDLIKQTVKHISTETQDYSRFGVTKDYLVIMSRKEIKKYSLTTDELIETKNIEMGGNPFYFHGTEKNNTLYYTTNDSLLKTINLDNYEIKVDLTLDMVDFAHFIFCSDGIWVNGYGNNNTYLFNLEKKAIAYKLNPKVHPFGIIIKEAKK